MPALGACSYMCQHVELNIGGKHAVQLATVHTLPSCLRYSLLPYLCDLPVLI